MPGGSISEDDEEVTDTECVEKSDLLSVLLGEDVLISSATERPGESPGLANSPQSSTSRTEVHNSPLETARFQSPVPEDGEISNISDFSSSSDDESDADEVQWKKQSWQQSPNLENFDCPPLRCTKNLLNRIRPVTYSYFELFFDNEVMDNG